MAEYYSLIVKAVAGLEKNTGEARRALYERARTALVAQLRGVTPELSESDITRERLALEEAIRKVEAESARKARLEQPRASPPARNRAMEALRAEETARVAAAPPPPREIDITPTVDADIQTSAAVPDEAPYFDRVAPEPAPEVAPRPVARERAPVDESLSVTDAGLKGFRDVIAETDEIGRATARAARSAREAYASVPSPSPEFDRLEPRLEPEQVRVRARAPASPGPIDLDAEVAAGRPLPLRPRPPREPDAEEDIYERPPPRPRARATYAEEEDEDEHRPSPLPRSWRGLITTVVVLLLLSGVAATAFWQRESIATLYRQVMQLAPGQQARAPREPSPTRPKISDRVGQEQASLPSGRTGTLPGSAQQQAAPVAQRVVLYEEDPADPQGKRYIGSAIWRTETVSPGPGLAPDIAVRADVEIPDRRFTMTFSLRRNTDQALPASHTVEIMFTLPADFPAGGIANVPGILMKQAEQTRGTPLAGLAVKVTTGFFLIGLSAVATDLERNMQLLKERSWFDIPVVYNNGTRAILAIEKGTPGERAFADAFAAWERTGQAGR
jgi:hypothetical protein